MSLAHPLASQERAPVLDMHLHALAADAQGPPPLAMCTPMQYPGWDPGQAYGARFMEMLQDPACDDAIWSPETDDEVLRRTLDVMERLDVYGVLSGTPERVAAWRAAAPDRFIGGVVMRDERSGITPDSLRALVESGAVEVLGEVTNQYAGVAPDDPRLEPYWSLAEELDIPVGIHIGPGPPGVVYLGSDGYRARLHSALTLEPVLIRHPRLRVYIMHAGFPLLDDLLAVLYAHPQVHVDTGVIVFSQSRRTFYRYLRGIVEAGFEERVMFGSDQMVWPEVIERSIDVIREAPFLSQQQKRAILYDNAARFLRLDEATVARHHGR